MSRANGASTLVLFDIDGTLTRRTGPHHKRALEQGVLSVTGVSTTLEGVPTQGMLDCDLIRAMLVSAGVKSSPVNEIFSAAQSYYLSDCAEDLSHCVCPGVLQLLNHLESQSIPRALVTGNLSAIGWKKLELAGLRRYFLHGAFSEEADTRASLAALAVLRAQEAGVAPDNCSVWLIGDHPNDINAAKANGFRAIAVATGFSSMEELAAAEADIVVGDLTELDPELFLPR